MDSKQTILVVEDHEALNAMICRALQKGGHDAHGVLSAEDLQEYSGLSNVDVFVVDWNLPGESGVSLVERIRQTWPQTGIIMITARSGTESQLMGYASGADFYLTKPVRGEDLLQAVDILRNRQRKRLQEGSDVYQTVGVLYRDRLALQVGEASVSLSMPDVRVLTAFAVAKKGTLQAWQILDILNLDAEQQSVRLIEVRMSRLRKKLAAVFGEGNHLLFIRDQGYRLTCTIQLA